LERCCGLFHRDLKIGLKFRCGDNIAIINDF
jgi:hypothetical protein